MIFTPKGRALPAFSALLALAGLLAIVHSRSSSNAPAGVTVTLEPETTFQTILGWGVSAPLPEDVTRYLPEVVLEELLNDAVRQFGLNRIRYFPSTYAEPWEPINDNANPRLINFNAFNLSFHQRKVRNFFAPLKTRVQALGESLDFYLSFSFGPINHLPDWLLQNPQEYAEHVVALAMLLNDQYGMPPNYVVIQNEPGSGHPTPRFHADVIQALGPRLRELGLPTRIQFVDGIDARTTWHYIQDLQNVTEIWPFVGLLSHHLYGTSDPYRSLIRDFGVARGIPTGQTETMNAGIHTLFDDLILGGVSYWEASFGLAWWNDQPGRGALYQIPLSGTSFSRHPDFWCFRQITHYVRRGAVRIEARSSSGQVRSLAFSTGGRATVVLYNTGPEQPVHVQNIPRGAYGLSRVTGGGLPVELGVRNLSSPGPLTLTLPPNSLTTIYPYEGPDLPPQILDAWASPRGPIGPGAKVTLSARASDPELDPIHYSWAIRSAPPGASVALSAPKSHTTDAFGFSAPGDYVFTVTAQSNHQSARRDVLVRVAVSNQPPRLIDLHNRTPSVVVSPAAATTLRSAAIDPEGDNVRFQWQVAAHPAGASPRLATPSESSCLVSGLTVPGLYVFQITLRDGHNTVTDQLTVRVYPRDVTGDSIFTSPQPLPRSPKGPDDRPRLPGPPK
ncbi:MAG: hypothetical protein NZM33_11685 [Bryobacteraceae bacterium]|nr:hypothetical protein [Bryobacteraceae bacterium]